MKILKPEFVEFIPKEIEDGMIFISMQYRTAVHNCACGCGEKVVTRFSPKDWKLTFDGRSVSLYPSIGNWGFPCRSHYFIRNNQIIDAPKWPSQTDTRQEKIPGWRRLFTKRKLKGKGILKLGIIFHL